MPSHVEIAESLTELGVPVLPLTPGKTHPHMPARAELGWPPYTPGWVRCVWESYPECGVAIATDFCPKYGRGVIAIKLNHAKGPGALLPPPMLPKTLSFSLSPKKTLLLYWAFGRVKSGEVNAGVRIIGENKHVPIDPDIMGEDFWRRPWPLWREVAPAPLWVYVPKRLLGVQRPTYWENGKWFSAWGARLYGHPTAHFWHKGVWRLGEAPLAILRFAIDRRFEGGDRETIVSEALTLNAETCIPPLPEGDVRAIAEWVCDHLPPKPDWDRLDWGVKEKTFPLWELHHAD
jgi:hypothetical protein